MPTSASKLLRPVVRISAVLIAVNEIRGTVLAAPILFAMYESGGPWMALWLGFCALSGLALSVVLPSLVLRKLAALA
jgi:hypothetical protein